MASQRCSHWSSVSGQDKVKPARLERNVAGWSCLAAALAPKGKAQVAEQCLMATMPSVPRSHRATVSEQHEVRFARVEQHVAGQACLAAALASKGKVQVREQRLTATIATLRCSHSSSVSGKDRVKPAWLQRNVAGWSCLAAALASKGKPQVAEQRFIATMASVPSWHWATVSEQDKVRFARVVRNVAGYACLAAALASKGKAQVAEQCLMATMATVRSWQWATVSEQDKVRFARVEQNVTG